MCAVLQNVVARASLALQFPPPPPVVTSFQEVVLLTSHLVSVGSQSLRLVAGPIHSVVRAKMMTLG